MLKCCKIVMAFNNLLRYSDSCGMCSVINKYESIENINTYYI